MSNPTAHLTLHPDRCDRCLRCVRACPNKALKVGVSYIYVDWRSCTNCDTCIASCERQAIERRSVPSRPTASRSAVALGDVSHVVVGSRAEAKAVRKAAIAAAKSQSAHTRPGVRPSQPGRLAAPPARAAQQQSAEAKPAGATSQGARLVWTVPDAAVVLAALALTMVLKDVVLGLGPVQLMPQNGKVLIRALVLVVFYGMQFATFAWLARRRSASVTSAFGLLGGRDSRSGEGVPSALRSAGLVIGLFLAVEAVAIAYGLGIAGLGIEQPARLSSDLAAVFGAGGVGLALSGLLVVLIAPLAEELAFRGVLAPVLRERVGTWPAIAVSSAVYAAYHLSAWLFIPTFVLGLALGWLATTRRSLVPAIALHVLYNGAAVAAAFLAAR